MCNSDHEFMASAGLDVTWANTGTPNMSDPFNTYQPVLDVGKGFGDLPASLNMLRPIAVTAELSESLPGQAWTNGNQNSTNINWGFTVQYSLPYYNSNVAEIDNDFFKRLVPITEFTFARRSRILRREPTRPPARFSRGRSIWRTHGSSRLRRSFR